MEKKNRKSPGEELKNRIADSFEQHFLHFGFKKTAVDEVAAEMGVSKKTIYKHFDSKEGIFYFVISRKAENRRKIVEEKIKHLNSAMMKMESMIRINFDEFRKFHCKKMPTFIDRYHSEIASGAFREAFNQLVSEVLKEGEENDEFEISDHEMTVRYIQSLIAESFKILREDKDAKPEDFLVNTIGKILLNSKSSK